jgi:hypothetical protein
VGPTSTKNRWSEPQLPPPSGRSQACHCFANVCRCPHTSRVCRSMSRLAVIVGRCRQSSPLRHFLFPAHSSRLFAPTCPSAMPNPREVPVRSCKLFVAWFLLGMLPMRVYSPAVPTACLTRIVDFCDAGKKLHQSSTSPLSVPPCSYGKIESL